MRIDYSSIITPLVALRIPIAVLCCSRMNPASSERRARYAANAAAIVEIDARTNARDICERFLASFLLLLVSGAKDLGTSICCLIHNSSQDGTVVMKILPVDLFSASVIGAGVGSRN